MSLSLAANPKPARGALAGSDALWIVPPVLVLLGSFIYPLSLIVGQAFTGAEGGFSLETVEGRLRLGHVPRRDPPYRGHRAGGQRRVPRARLRARADPLLR